MRKIAPSSRVRSVRYYLSARSRCNLQIARFRVVRRLLARRRRALEGECIQRADRNLSADWQRIRVGTAAEIDIGCVRNGLSCSADPQLRL